MVYNSCFFKCYISLRLYLEAKLKHSFFSFDKVGEIFD